jgi:predicted nucleic acid-binding protein
LDACALIAYVKKEQNSEIIQNLLKQAESGEVSVSINIVNLLEVYYGFYRERGKPKTNMIMQEIYSLPIQIIDTITVTVFEKAGHLKGTYEISLADSFAAATAACMPATLITKDHEFKPVQMKEGIAVLWIG